MNALSTVDAACAYVGRGFSVVALRPGMKRPIDDGWPNSRLGMDDLSRQFANGNNIGIILGAVSDVDLDCAEARALALDFLPPTSLIHGRPSAPRSHWWYRADREHSVRRFQDPTGGSIVELRGRGGQTMVPPSVHPSGEMLTWACDGEPAAVPTDTLIASVSRLAVDDHHRARNFRPAIIERVAGAR